MASKFVNYLIITDYFPSIQKGQLLQLVQDALNVNSSQRIFCESWSIGQIRSYLKVEYDLDFELTPTNPWDSNRETYFANERIVLDFDAWVSKKLYQQGDCIINSAIAYICTVDNQDESFDPTKWNLIGNQYDLYFIPLPYPVFSLRIQKTKNIYTAGFYQVGDIVWWNNHTYTCLVATQLIDSDTAIQYISTNSIPPANVFPDDPKNGARFWQDNGEYSLENEMPSTGNQDGGIWNKGDNRDIIMVQNLIDLTVWKLHSRISPNNIPKLREDNKNAVFQFLRSAKDDVIQLDLMPLQPLQGSSVRWGSKPKNVNGY